MKSLTLRQPMELGQTMVDINNFMESVFGESPFSRSQPDARIGFPRVDIHETNDSYHIDAELPGYEEKDIEISVDSGVLNIQSKKETEKKTDDKNYIIHERHLDVFSRAFKLPDNADCDSIAASFKNGLLSLEIKKRAEAQKRMISIGK
ncbi:MAG: Hsp20/alpha crystallin family protein [Spirochaetaceae bacterium]|jgi:HSP20 family protein|nr:Hsp20/alpha crystallin family protein [Spirochaetaceae bacterium]